MKLRFRPKALRDLEEIGDYIAADNPNRAASFVSELRAHCQRLLSYPKLYPVRQSIAGACRVVPHDNYLIIYQESDETVEIIRIFHGARNIHELF